MKIKTVCLDCGHVYDHDRSGERKVSKVKCPECGSQRKRTKVNLKDDDEPLYDNVKKKKTNVELSKKSEGSG